jgi:hypothetical protein
MKLTKEKKELILKGLNPINENEVNVYRFLRSNPSEKVDRGARVYFYILHRRNRKLL